MSGLLNKMFPGATMTVYKMIPTSIQLVCKSSTPFLVHVHVAIMYGWGK